jgi:glypican 6
LCATLRSIKNSTAMATPWTWLVLGLVSLLSVVRVCGQEGCNAVKNAYTSRGFNHLEVPEKMIPGEHLRICPRGSTCCTDEMEHKLSTESRQEFDKIMADKIGLLRNIFVSRTAKFDEFFTELLDNAKRDLHEMFVRTYGLLYQQNSYVFTDLFKDLRDYYKGRDTNLLDALDNFFSTLLQKMFELLNAQYTFDQDYLECVTEHMDDLKPFGDVPQKLSIQVKRAFIAARTFVQGLAIGRDVILEISKIQPTTSCSQALMKMMYCPYCRGLPYAKPCNNYCMNIMKGCLAHHADLNTEWNHYIDGMMDLAQRLEGPFNIEAVVDPIDVKISDAIMNFQENSEAVSTKVFNGCGRPNIDNRKKREADKGGSSSDDTYWNDFKNKKGKQPLDARPTTAAGTSLDRLVRDIKSKIEVAKDFWKDLPHSICNKQAAKISNEDNCWNGDGKAKYMPEVIGDGLLNQNNNPEVEVNVMKRNIVVDQQILQLKLITNKLKNAYSGVDVDWIDTADVAGSGEGSGSGAMDDGGSGYGGSGHHSDEDMNFNRADVTWQPPILVQTRRPKTQNKPGSKDNYNKDNYYTNYNGSSLASTSPSFLLLTISCLATILSLLHTKC